MNSSDTPAITVLMPAYNAGLYIRDAIDSILKQTFQDFEFIIINDGSKDDSLSIIQSYTDKRIRLINQENKGLIDSLNIGIKEAKSNIIARMDADDMSYATRLEKQYSFLQAHPDYVLVGSEADVVDKDGEYVYKQVPIGMSDEEIRENIDKACPFIHSVVTFRKEAVVAAGGYPKNALTFEDHLLWKKMLSLGKMCNFRESQGVVRFNPESVTIDERWRGEDFKNIRRRSVENGYVSESDAVLLKQIISNQNLGSYKRAAYYATIGKKYLWTNPNNKKARQNLLEAIRQYPKSIESYILYLFALVPSKARVGIYKMLKRK